MEQINSNLTQTVDHGNNILHTDTVSRRKRQTSNSAITLTDALNEINTSKLTKTKVKSFSNLLCKPDRNKKCSILLGLAINNTFQCSKEVKQAMLENDCFDTNLIESTLCNQTAVLDNIENDLTKEYYRISQNQIKNIQKNLLAKSRISDDGTDLEHKLENVSVENIIKNTNTLINSDTPANDLTSEINNYLGNIYNSLTSSLPNVVPDCTIQVPFLYQKYKNQNCDHSNVNLKNLKNDLANSQCVDLETNPNKIDQIVDNYFQQQKIENPDLKVYRNIKCHTILNELAQNKANKYLNLAIATQKSNQNVLNNIGKTINAIQSQTDECKATLIDLWEDLNKSICRIDSKIQTKIRKAKQKCDSKFWDQNNYDAYFENFKNLDNLSNAECNQSLGAFTNILQDRAYVLNYVKKKLCASDQARHLSQVVSLVRGIEYTEAHDYVCQTLTLTYILKDKDNLETSNIGQCTPHVEAFLTWYRNPVTHELDKKKIQTDAFEITCGTNQQSLNSKVQDIIDGMKPQKDKNMCKFVRNSSKSVQSFWGFIKPILFGKILYFPKNYVTDSIIREASGSLMALHHFKIFLKEWKRTYSAEIRNKMKNSSKIQCTRNFLEFENITNYLNENGIEDAWIEKFQSYIQKEGGTWEEDLIMLDSVFEQLSEILECIRFDKFRGCKNIEEDQGDSALDESTVDEFATADDKDAFVQNANFLSCTGDNVEGFETRQDMENYAKQLSKDKALFASIYFDLETGADAVDNIVEFQEWIKNIKSTSGGQNLELGRSFKYTIRQPQDMVPDTSIVVPRTWSPSAFKDIYLMQYFNYGFLYIQDMVDHAIIDVVDHVINADTTQLEEIDTVDHINLEDLKLVQIENSEHKKPLLTTAGSWVQMMPYPCYSYDSFVFFGLYQSFLPLLLVVCWFYPCAQLVKDIVIEKEKRLKELMKMMGMDNVTYFCGWGLIWLSIISISCLILSIWLVNFVLTYSSFILVLIWFLSFSFNVMSLSFMLSCFFTKANAAALTTTLLFIILHFPFYVLDFKDHMMPRYFKQMASYCGHIAFAYGSRAIGQLELEGRGLQWETLSWSEHEDRLNISECYLYLWKSSFLYLAVTWYMETAFPGEYGIARPWYFPFTISYWTEVFGVNNPLIEGGFYHKEAQFKDIKYEKFTGNNAIGASIHNLVMQYPGAKNKAVDNMNMNFYENQITSFLGHNGAGKTTTMSIMCGLFKPTQGTVYINNRDIRTHLNLVRTELGFCPQHDVLFDHLTVEQHILFYSALKGRDNTHKASQDELDQVLIDCGLDKRRHHLPSEISGGMRRKLSVATAFVGGSKVVILDEPTAGVDPAARRGVWDILMRYKQNRTVILCTHHMDEADLLGDRIAIMSAGKLLTVGSSHWLKSEYGDGFELTLVKADDYSNMDDDISVHSHMSGINDQEFIKNLERALMGYVPTKTFKLEDKGTEITFILPPESNKDSIFNKLFRFLDENMTQLGIQSYGLKDTSLEKIFLSVGSAHVKDSKPRSMMTAEERKKLDKSKMRKLKKAPKLRKIHGTELIIQQLRFMIARRWYCIRRNKSNLLRQILLPPVFIFLILFIQYLTNVNQDINSFELKLQKYWVGFEKNGKLGHFSKESTKMFQNTPFCMRKKSTNTRP